MRILCIVSGTWAHTLPEGFLEAGHEIKIVTVPLEEALAAAISSFRPTFALSIGWGKEQTPQNQLIIRKCLKAAKIPHIYWSVEDPEYTAEFSLPLLQIMQPDFVFTTCPSTAAFYRQLGFLAEHLDFGFAPKIHRPVAGEKTYKISVVANAYPNVLKTRPHHFRHQSMNILLVPLLQKSIRVDFWGSGWDRSQQMLKGDIPPEWLHGHIDYQQANTIYSASEVILGLQNYAQQVTQRTYEILASGGLLLTNDTPGVRSLFTPEEDLLVSASQEQTLQIITQYVGHPDTGKSIAKRGQQTVQPFSYKSRAEYILGVLAGGRILR